MLQRETLSSSKAVYLKIQSSTNVVSVSTCKVCRNTKDPCRIVSQQGTVVPYVHYTTVPSSETFQVSLYTHQGLQPNLQYLDENMLLRLFLTIELKLHRATIFVYLDIPEAENYIQHIVAFSKDSLNEYMNFLYSSYLDP